MSSSSTPPRPMPPPAGNVIHLVQTSNSTSGNSPRPSLVSVASTTSISSSSVSPSASNRASSSNSNAPPLGAAVTGVSNLTINTTSSTAPHSPPSRSDSLPNKRPKSLGAPPGYNNKFLHQMVDNVVPNGSEADRALLVMLLQLVLRDLPSNVTGESLEAHLQSNGLVYHSASVNQFAAKAILKFLSHVEHAVAAKHDWPWGVVCQKSVLAPYTDYDGSNRITFAVPENFMSSPLACFTGALASLNANVEGGSWSESKPDNFNVYVESIECARNIFRYRDNFIIQDVNGGKDTPVLLKRDKCALVHSTLFKVFVGKIRAGLTEIEVEDILIQVVRDGKIPPANFVYFAVHRTKGPNGKASNFGFAHVIGEEVASFLCLGATQPDYAGRFIVKQIKQNARK
eukprot:Phypoly_transcript_08453.p1 GENE.Phypoly_transcript_08453~~Phypoly_transcript_08453.p1  ORF type:complete len:470 (+),score=33.07 Phypoly_transcript_08453:212-1411(+)